MGHSSFPVSLGVRFQVLSLALQTLDDFTPAHFHRMCNPTSCIMPANWQTVKIRNRFFYPGFRPVTVLSCFIITQVYSTVCPKPSPVVYFNCTSMQ